MLGPSSKVSATHLWDEGPRFTVPRPTPVQPTRRTGTISVLTAPFGGARSTQTAAPRSPPGTQAGPYQLLDAEKPRRPGLIPRPDRDMRSRSPRLERSILAVTEPLP